jgi:hypothetical protein
MRRIILGLMGLGIWLFVVGQVNADITTGLVGDWQLDGNGTDSSGNGHDGTVVGATPTQDRFGNANGALQFDGVSAHVAVPNAPDLNPTTAITFTAWFKYASYNGGWPCIIAKDDGTNFHCSGWVLNTTGDQPLTLNASVCTDGTFQQSWYQQGNLQERAPGAVNQWYFAAGVYDGSKMTLYLGSDGQTLTSVSDSGSGNILSTATDLWIGADSDPFNGQAWAFNGAIDDVRVYNRALSASDICELSGFAEVIPANGDGGGGGTSPEPSTLVLLGIGAVSMMAYAWRKRRRTA